MKLNKIFKIAANIIIHSKLRSWLTVIGIVIGVAAIIAIISIGTGYEAYINDQMSEFGSDIIYVIPGFDKASQASPFGPPDDPSSNINPLTDKEVQAIKSITNVERVNKGVQGSAEVYYLGGTASLTVSGVDLKEWKHVASLTIGEGRLLGPGDSNSVVIGGTVAEDLFDNEVGLNRMLTVGDKNFRVVGILEKGGAFGSNDKNIYMAIDSAREILEKPIGEYDALEVQISDIEYAEEVEIALEKKLMIVRHVNKDTKDFTLISMKSVQDNITAILEGFTFFLAVIAAVSLLVGAVGIANTMFTSVLEKTREIGIMKALGAKNSSILWIFLLNSGMVGLVGGVFGVILGVAISFGISASGFAFGAAQEGLQTIVTPGLVIFAICFSIILGMISGAIPAYRASKLNPVDSLRYE